MAIPLILVVGPTASGKSALAVQLALRLQGEVVSADAMAVYRGMDLGTAKPDAATLARVPHHLISILEPSDRCNASRWVTLADAAIADIHARGRVPIIAGGTPLYTKMLIEGVSAGTPRDDALRAELSARYDREGPAVLFAELQVVDPVYATAHHANDKQRIVRALEVARVSGRPYSSFHTTDGGRRGDLRTLQLGLRWDRAVLYGRISARTDALFAAGLVEEVRGLASQLSAEARQAVGYKEVLDHLAGEVDRERAIERVKLHSRHLAKHQLTWYRRFADIIWLSGDAPDLAQQAEQIARRFLASEKPLTAPPATPGTPAR